MNINMDRSMENLLAQFILDRMKEQDKSARKFADEIGIGRQTINNILAPNTTPGQYPAFQTLVALAEKTGTDIGLLAQLAAPEHAKRDVRGDLLIEVIRRLSPDDREVVDRFIHGRLLRYQQENEGD